MRLYCFLTPLLYFTTVKFFPLIDFSDSIGSIKIENEENCIMRKKRLLLLIGVDSLIMLASLAFVSLLHFFAKADYPRLSVARFFICLALLFVLHFSARIIAKTYRSVWRYSNVNAYFSILIPDLIVCVIYVLTVFFAIGYPIILSVLVETGILLLTLSSRLTYQWLYLSATRRQNLSESEERKAVAIVGAGMVGVMLAEELRNNARSHYRPVCFIDTAPDKIGKFVCGLRVYKEEPAIIRRLRAMRVDEIVLALPSLPPEEKKKLFDFYSRTRKKVKMYDFAYDEPSLTENGKRQLREFAIEDLLFRETIKVTSELTTRFYRNKVVLVTGGGGSIGSELCRQIARRHPKKLVIFDIYENNAYDIQQELRSKYGASLDLSVEIGSVRDRTRLDGLFAKYRPEIVFHAAAHKHVPLMEDSAGEAIKNNVLGTYNTADMAEKYGVKKFILISTDKAVNPTNVMGASKRMCEMVVQCRRAGSNTEFAAVRFGNVLGSNGSVIPLFRRQIQSGGPVTITDKRIIRYFMTIPEASQLVMQAGAMAKSGELFVLDMGKPIKILDLAENIIRLSGLIPYRDIDIKEIGLRPGEKLYEELLIKTEELDKTDNQLIFIERDEPLSRSAVEEKLTRLREVVDADPATVRRVMMELIPTFHDPSEVNKAAANAEEMKIVAKEASPESEENTDKTE